MDNSEAIPIKPLFSISPAAMGRVVAIVLMLAAVVTTILTSNFPTGETLGMASTPIIGGALVGGVAALFVRNKRSVVFINAWLIVGACFSVLLILGGLGRARASTMENSPETQAQIDARFRAVFSQPSSLADALQLERQKLETMRWAQGISRGSSARFYKVFAVAHEEQVTSLAEVHTALSQLDLRQLPTKASSLNTREAVSSSLAQVRAAQDAVRRLVAFVDSRVSELSHRLERENAHPALTRGALKALAANLPEERQSLNVLLGVLDVHQKLLVLLEDTWGAWTYDRGLKQFQFKSESDQQRFDAIAHSASNAAPKTPSP